MYTKHMAFSWSFSYDLSRQANPSVCVSNLLFYKNQTILSLFKQNKYVLGPTVTLITQYLKRANYTCITLKQNLL